MAPSEHGGAGPGPGEAGRGEMEAEHQVQVSLLYALRQAVSAGQADNAQELLERLTAYSKMHFASEQLLMRLYQYDGYAGHVAEHEQMIEALEGLSAAEAEEAAAVGRWIDALDASLVRHIRSADRALGHYLAALGSGPHPQP
ncbi:MAG TPA: hemerythrin family protein [Rhodospirillales bacterium]|nr:hemerythrin family protein [Rhodospirillales bacterium]